MALRIALGGLRFEGNSFSSVYSGLDAFTRVFDSAGESLLSDVMRFNGSERGAMGQFAAAGAEVLPLRSADAGAGGRVKGQAWMTLRDETLDRLASALPVDGVYLALHGAMLAEDEDDPEGSLLAAVRKLVGGGTPIAVSLDLHAHVTGAMVEAADITVGHRLYPHLDAQKTGARAAEILLRTLKGEVRPVIGFSKLAMLNPVTGQCTDPGQGPFADLREQADRLEGQPGVLSVSLFGVQPWLDLPDAGYTALVICDADVALAQKYADELCTAAWARRYEFDHRIWSIEDALEDIRKRGSGQHLLVDAADCVGGGASGRSAAVLEGLLRLAPDLPAGVLFRDPEAVMRANEIGVGQTGLFSAGDEGRRAEFEARVEHIFDGDFVFKAGPRAGAKGQLGPSACLAAGAIKIVITTFGAYEFGDEQYAAAGIDCSKLVAVAVKNPMNFRAGFPDRVAAYVLSTPGETSPDLRRLNWSKKERPFFPMDDSRHPLFIRGNPSA